MENNGGGENPAIKYSTFPKVFFYTTYVIIFFFNFTLNMLYNITIISDNRLVASFLKGGGTHPFNSLLRKKVGGRGHSPPPSDATSLDKENEIKKNQLHSSHLSM